MKEDSIRILKGKKMSTETSTQTETISPDLMRLLFSPARIFAFRPYETRQKPPSLNEWFPLSLFVHAGKPFLHFVL